MNIQDPQNRFDPHAAEIARTRGLSPEKAQATLLLIHGRGASAEDILSLFDQLDLDQCAAIAPQAAGHTWYPHSFLAPLTANQPYLDSALRRIHTLVEGLLNRGIPSERIVLLGFSQGACLAAEYTARHPRRFGAVLALTGGLIGPPGTPRNYAGALDGTPVFLGAGDPDPHVPFSRVEETAQVLGRMGASVDLRRYPGMPHTINEDELAACRLMIQHAAEVARTKHS